MKNRYTPGTDISEVSDGMTPTGLTSKQLVSLEEEAQRNVAEAEEWRLAREMNYVRGESARGSDSREELEAMGFTILQEGDLFYITTPPEGWTKTTQGFWTSVCDEEGNERISMFFKGAVYDRRAFLSIK